MVEEVKFPSDHKSIQPTRGSAGLRSHVPGGMATVSALSLSTGGIGPGHFVETDNR